MNFGVYSDGITFQELKSYCELTKTKLTKFEINTIRTLSYEYINMLRLAKDKDCEQPYKLDKI